MVAAVNPPMRAVEGSGGSVGSVACCPAASPAGSSRMRNPKQANRQKRRHADVQRICQVIQTKCVEAAQQAACLQGAGDKHMNICMTSEQQCGCSVLLGG